MSVDALRGFDMFWIVGADALFQALDKMSRGAASSASSEVRHFSLTGFLAGQLEHSEWAGFHFYDLIFPLFVFITGVSLVFSLGKAIQQEGRAGALKRMVRRSLLLFALGVFYWGGISGRWPGVRLAGVLQRIALCYFVAGALFCFLNRRALVAVCAALLVGYWAVMTFVPIRDIRLERGPLSELTRQTGIKEPRLLFQMTTSRVRGKFGHGYNVADHFDFQYLPGEKYDTYFDPEGYLSTFPAIATCLLGVFAGLWLRNQSIPELKKVLWLMGAGCGALAAGCLWGLQFPPVEKIWTSSFVLVAAGWSAILLGLFYLLIEIWQFRAWCQPFVWMGMNSITIYLVSAVIGTWRKPALRLAGGDVKTWLDARLVPGSGDLLVALVGLLLALWFVRFLYRRNVFLRL
jgi:predicted acyltransferase